MIGWLIAVALLVLLWGALWRRNVMFAFGILMGLPLAWILSRLIRPYVTGMEEIPVWLPPAPFAIIAVTLFVYGTLTWFRAGDYESSRSEQHEEEHEHGH